MKKISKNLALGILSIALTLFVVSGVIHATQAFKDPAATENGGVLPPIHTGGTQVKDGSFSVGNFAADTVALFKQDLFVSSYLTGALFDNPKDANIKDTMVAFGGIKLLPLEPGGDPLKQGFETYATSAIASDGIRTTRALYSGKLLNNNDKPAPTCADAYGNVVKCNDLPPEGDDQCPNIFGVQVVVPNGMYITDQGNCQFTGARPSKEDWCPNMLGNQTVFPLYDTITEKLVDGNSAPSAALRPTSWNSAYDCVPRPMLTKVEWYSVVSSAPKEVKQNKGPSSYNADISTTLKFTLDKPALGDEGVNGEIIGVRGIDIQSGTDVGPAAYIHVKPGSTVVEYTVMKYGVTNNYSLSQNVPPIGTIINRWSVSSVYSSSSYVYKFTDDNKALGGQGADYDLGAWNSAGSGYQGPDGYCVAGSQFSGLVPNKPDSTIIIPPLYRYWSNFSNGVFQGRNTEMNPGEFNRTEDCRNSIATGGNIDKFFLTHSNKPSSGWDGGY